MTVMTTKGSADREERLKALLIGDELAQLKAIEARLDDPEAVAKTVSPALVEALRLAGSDHPRKLADAIAPYMVQAMRREIKNSQEMMVEALYPITGRLVAAAVRQRFKELMETIDARLDQSFSFERWRNRIEAKITGRTEAEIQLARLGAFSIETALVLERDTGRVLASAGDDQTARDPQMVGGMIAAVMGFAREAIGGEGKGDELRTIEAGDHELRLFASPASVLAIRSEGAPPPGFERAVTELFYDFLDEWAAELREAAATGEQASQEVVTDLRRRFDALLDPNRLRNSGRSRRVLLAAVVAVAALCGWIGYDWWRAERAAEIEATAWRVISEEGLLTGFPIEAYWDENTNRLEVVGFAPDVARRAALAEALRDALPDVSMVFSVADLSVALADQRAEFALAEAERAALAARQTALAEQLDAIAPLARLRAAAIEDILFTEDDRPRDPGAAQATVAAIARAMTAMADPPTLVVIGHGDVVGTEEATDRASQARAELIRRWLVDAGVPPERMLIVGRSREGAIDGENPNRNRRVSFELAGRP